MSDSPRFNICEKCGSTNPFSAKFCFNCGNPLRTANQTVVCESCSTANSVSARFCKFCGKPLYKDSNAPKTCPRCNNTVSAGMAVCDKCHYRMPIEQQPQPQDISADAPLLLKNQSAQPQIRRTTIFSSKKATAGALSFCFLFLLFAYLLLGWEKIIPSWLLELGVFDLHFGEIGNTTGLSILTKIFASSGVTSFDWINFFVIALAMITLVVAFVINLVRIFTGRQTKGFAWWYLAVALISTLSLIVFWVASASEVVATLLGTTCSLAQNGILAYIIPVGYTVAFVLSLFFKKRNRQDMHTVIC